MRAGHPLGDAAVAAPATAEFYVEVIWYLDELATSSYTTETLERLFSKYGECDVLMSKKVGKAMVSFASLSAARIACQNERGLPLNPFMSVTCTGLAAAPSAAPVNRTPLAPQMTAAAPAMVGRESDILARMRKMAEEKKRLSVVVPVVL